MKSEATHSSTIAAYSVALALLMFSFITLCGVLLNIAPFVIAKRATIGGLITWWVTHAGLRMITRVMTK